MGQYVRGIGLVPSLAMSRFILNEHSTLDPYAFLAHVKYKGLTTYAGVVEYWSQWLQENGGGQLLRGKTAIYAIDVSVVVGEWNSVRDSVEHHYVGKDGSLAEIESLMRKVRTKSATSVYSLDKDM